MKSRLVARLMITLIAAGITLVGQPPLCSAAGLGLEISPPMVDLPVTPGQETVIPISLGNSGDLAAVNVRVYLCPVVQNRDGVYKLKPEEKDNPWSAISWLDLKEETLTLGPSKETQVTVKVKPPRNAVGSRVAAVVFEVVPEGAQKSTTEGYSGTTTFSHRLTTIIKLTANSRGNRLDASLSGLSLVSGASDPRFSKYGERALAVVCTVVNEGNTLIAGQGRLIIRNAAGRRINDGPLGGGRGVVIPGATVDFVSVFPSGLPEGSYTAEATIYYGGARPVQARMPFTIAGQGAQIGDAQVLETVKLSVTPEQVTTQLAPGAFRTIPFSLINRDKTPIAVSSKIQELASTPEGDLVATAGPPGSWSAAGWLTVGQGVVKIAPGERKNLEVRVAVPKETADGVRYAAVVLEAQRDEADRPEAVTTVTTPVFITTGRKLERKAELKDTALAFTDEKKTVALFGVVLTNRGNTYLAPSGQVVLRKRGVRPTLAGGLEYLGEAKFEDVATLQLQGSAGRILSGEERSLVAALNQALEPGEYQAEFVVDIGEQLPLRSTLTFLLAPQGVDVDTLPAATE